MSSARAHAAPALGASLRTRAAAVVGHLFGLLNRCAARREHAGRERVDARRRERLHFHGLAARGACEQALELRLGAHADVVGKEAARWLAALQCE
eukprot:1500938-Prymnesium_polylepis.1